MGSGCGTPCCKNTALQTWRINSPKFSSETNTQTFGLFDTLAVGTPEGFARNLDGFLIYSLEFLGDDPFGDSLWKIRAFLEADPAAYTLEKEFTHDFDGGPIEDLVINDPTECLPQKLSLTIAKVAADFVIPDERDFGYAPNRIPSKLDVWIYNFPDNNHGALSVQQFEIEEELGADPDFRTWSGATPPTPGSIEGFQVPEFMGVRSPKKSSTLQPGNDGVALWQYGTAYDANPLQWANTQGEPGIFSEHPFDSGQIGNSVSGNTQIPYFFIRDKNDLVPLVTFQFSNIKVGLVSFADCSSLLYNIKYDGDVPGALPAWQILYDEAGVTSFDSLNVQISGDYSPAVGFTQVSATFGLSKTTGPNPVALFGSNVDGISKSGGEFNIAIGILKNTTTQSNIDTGIGIGVSGSLVRIDRPSSCGPIHIDDPDPPDPP